MTCSKCGAALGESDKFCTACGASRPESSAAPAPQNFCQHCGTALSPGEKFCVKCGTPIGSSAPQVVSAPAAASQAPPPSAAAAPTAQTIAPARPEPAQPAPKKKSSAKLIGAVLIVFALFVLTGIAGVTYVVYRAKQKVDEIRQAKQQNDATALLKAITGNSGGSSSSAGGSSSSGQANQNEPTGAAIQKLAGDGAEALMRKMMGGGSGEVPKLPEWSAAPADLVSSRSSKIPLRASLRIVMTGTEPARGDFESIFLVDSVTSQQIHIAAHQQFPNRKDMNTVMAQNGPNGFNATSLPSSDQALKINCSQIELKADLENATSQPPYFCQQGHEDKFPGTTSLGVSRKLFTDLKVGKEVTFVTYENPMNAMFKSFKDLVSGSGDPSDFLNRVLSAAPGGTPPATPPIHVTLHSISGDIAFPVVVNEVPVQLPALHITGSLSDGTSFGDAFILDDAENPLILAAQTKINGTGQVTKISWDSDKPNNPIQQQLEKEGRAKVYGIYFDFGSDQLRAESDTVLREIAAAMNAHPDWKLRVEGHTDNIGGDAFNQTLSANRAAAVKGALVASYGISGDRLDTAGFGDTRPAASNDTLEGRALNRRVELVRE